MTVTMTERVEAVQAAPLCLDSREGDRWGEFVRLARAYVKSLRGRHPRPPTLRALVEQTLREEVMVYLASRGAELVGFGMVAARRGGSGDRVMWVSHCYCPGDLGALRALVREFEHQAQAAHCDWIGFEATVPDMRRRAASVGFRPASTIYAKEVRNG
jgi:hypothetical protein